MLADSPTKVRHKILATATMVAFLMYLDRICLANIIGSDSFQKNIQLGTGESDWVKLAFFWAYALFQVPAGWLSDRFGARVLITSTSLRGRSSPQPPALPPALPHSSSHVCSADLPKLATTRPAAACSLAGHTSRAGDLPAVSSPGVVVSVALSHLD
jgi:MFS family permease